MAIRKCMSTLYHKKGQPLSSLKVVRTLCDAMRTMQRTAVFLLLMQQILQGRNPHKRPDFVSANLNDVLILSHTLDLELVISHEEEAGG